MRDPQIQRIIDACHAKGVPLSELADDLRCATEVLVQLLMASALPEKPADLVKTLNYTCLACRVEVHDVCMNNRPPGLPMEVCICSHRKETTH